jgi:predicted house-cleaning NTP pyrophosphatase (Maf/HAM1 superfamily)
MRTSKNVEEEVVVVDNRVTEKPETQEENYEKAPKT